MSDDQLVELKVPTIGESISSAFIGRWLKQPGDSVEAGEDIVELDSDKASLEVPSPAAGVVKELKAEDGDEVPIGSVIAVIDTSGAGASGDAGSDDDAANGQGDDGDDGESGESGESGEDDGAARQSTPSSKGPQSGPAARQAASEHGVDIREVEGSGRGGRVLSRDVEASAKRGEARPAPVQESVDTEALEERVAMTPLRRTIARRLVEAQQSAAILTTFNEVDLTAVKAIRKRYQDRFVKRYGVKLGFMSFFVKAAIEALKEFPAVNAEIDDSNASRPEIVYKRYYNIGVAVSTERGLVVPVLRNADRLGFAETELAINELAGKARDGKLGVDDFKGGTFTISNGGVFGSLMSTPILNRPQVGILGMHTIQERPVGVDGRIELRPMMYLALSYDHRIIDGREAVRFLVRIKELVEDPERILLEV